MGIAGINTAGTGNVNSTSARSDTKREAKRSGGDSERRFGGQAAEGAETTKGADAGGGGARQARDGTKARNIMPDNAVRVRTPDNWVHVDVPNSWIPVRPPRNTPVAPHPR